MGQPLVRPSSSNDGSDDDDASGKNESRLLEAKREIPWKQWLSTDGERNLHSAGRRPGSLHHRFEKIDDLSGPAKAFHDKVAELSGLPMEELVRAVFKLEQLLIYWTDHSTKGTAEPLDRVVEGVESWSLAKLLGVKQI